MVRYYYLKAKLFSLNGKIESFRGFYPLEVSILRDFKGYFRHLKPKKVFGYGCGSYKFLFFLKTFNQINESFIYKYALSILSGKNPPLKAEISQKNGDDK